MTINYVVEDFNSNLPPGTCPHFILKAVSLLKIVSLLTLDLLIYFLGQLTYFENIKLLNIPRYTQKGRMRLS